MGSKVYKKLPFSLDRARHGDLVNQISGGLRTAIVTGYYAPGDILPPVRDLARLLGVSKGIAEQSLARIREEGLVSPRPRIGSVVCAKEHPLWKGQIVIVVPPGRGNPLENAIYAILRDALTSAGYLTASATVAATRRERFDDFALLDTVLRQQTDLVIELEDRPTIGNWLSKRGVPFIRLSNDDFRPPSCVGLIRRRDDLALPDFVAHCREAGVKSLLQVQAYSRGNAAEVLAAEGVRVTNWRVPSSIDQGNGYDLSSWAAETFSKRLAKGRSWLPDLIFFNDDHLATGALMALGAAGVRIPEDVRVATWANRRYGPVYVKPLTRMEMDIDAVGNKLADAALDYLRTGSFPSDVVIGPEYIRGETF